MQNEMVLQTCQATTDPGGTFNAQRPCLPNSTILQQYYLLWLFFKYFVYINFFVYFIKISPQSLSGMYCGDKTWPKAPTLLFCTKEDGCLAFYRKTKGEVKEVKLD